MYFIRLKVSAKLEGNESLALDRHEKHYAIEELGEAIKMLSEGTGKEIRDSAGPRKVRLKVHLEIAPTEPRTLNREIVVCRQSGGRYEVKNSLARGESIHEALIEYIEFWIRGTESESLEWQPN